MIHSRRQFPSHVFNIPKHGMPDPLWMICRITELRGLAEYKSARALDLSLQCGVPVPGKRSFHEHKRRQDQTVAALMKALNEVSHEPAVTAD